ncbi:hypothetical protein T4C_4141 [Trichinella pseudospiralis]|uniref:Uncharacterized protein n=1 Tax=Trichinella pseudospiralis TaxID=6337 RepID=A0A0V1GDH7_TRIPS|nr:hypothetical protein T4C_4141 [Trichinella pseudospiralis]
MLNVQSNVFLVYPVAKLRKELLKNITEGEE